MTRRKKPTAGPSGATQGKKYPGIKGKVVDFADHAFEEGLLYIRVRFADKTELCWRVSSSTLIEEAGLSELPRPKGTGSNDNEGNHATQHRR